MSDRRAPSFYQRPREIARQGGRVLAKSLLGSGRRRTAIIKDVRGSQMSGCIA